MFFFSFSPSPSTALATHSENDSARRGSSRGAHENKHTHTHTWHFTCGYDASLPTSFTVITVLISALTLPLRKWEGVIKRSVRRSKNSSRVQREGSSQAITVCAFEHAHKQGQHNTFKPKEARNPEDISKYIVLFYTESIWGQSYVSHITFSQKEKCLNNTLCFSLSSASQSWKEVHWRPSVLLFVFVIIIALIHLLSIIDFRKSTVHCQGGYWAILQGKETWLCHKKLS